MKSLCLLYHINLNHLSFTFEQREKYIKTQLAEILDNTVVNSNVSITAEDLTLLKIWNYEVYKKLVDHPKIKLIYMPYSHLISDLFERHYIENVNLGKRILEKHVPRDKLQNIFYPSEVEWPGPLILKFLCGMFGAVVLGESRIQVLEQFKDKNSYPPYFTIKCTEGSILAVLSRREFNYRKYLHEYYIGGVTANEVAEALKQDLHKYSGGRSLTARIDMEVIPFNISYSSLGEPQKLPTGRFLTLQDCLIKDGFKFKFMENAISEIEDFKCVSAKNVVLDPLESYKWDNTSLKDEVEDLYKEIITKDQKVIWHSALCSDYYYSNMKDFKRPLHKNPKKYILIVKNRKYRDPESLFKLQMFKNNGGYYLPKDRYLETYFSYFSKLVKYISNEFI